VFPGALSDADLDRARTGLQRGVELQRQNASAARGSFRLDPNEANIRVNNLPAIDPEFLRLLVRPDALEAARAVLGPHVLISNFSANIALPGSGQMRLHSDQSLAVPPPWGEPWAVNVIWCLDDVHESNGATRYLPGSHRFRTPEEVPADALDRTVAMEAPAGSFILMEGRLWHTSGRNVTTAGADDSIRRMLFAYYSCDFVRPQMNWNMTLPHEVRSGLDETARVLFGLTPTANSRIGAELTRLPG
jgi:ectoine hydroxylase-related dioxygenase (phytanoyl-CoA dioxygenase family)